MGPVYRASFWVQSGNGIRSFFRGLFRFVNSLLYSGAKAVGKKALKTDSNIIIYMLNKETKQPVSDIFKTRFIDAKGNVEQKIKKWRGMALV